MIHNLASSSSSSWIAHWLPKMRLPGRCRCRADASSLSRRGVGKSRLLITQSIQVCATVIGQIRLTTWGIALADKPIIYHNYIKIQLTLYTCRVKGRKRGSVRAYVPCPDRSIYISRRNDSAICASSLNLKSSSPERRGLINIVIIWLHALAVERSLIVVPV